MEQPGSMKELREKIATLQLKRKESEFFLEQEIASVVDSYSPSGILNSVMQNNSVSKKKWLILAIGIGLSALLRKYVFKPKEEPESNFLHSIISWFRESNNDLIDKGVDYLRDWIKGNKD